MTIVVALTLLPTSAAAAPPSPSPSLDTVLARPPAGDFNELTNSAFNGAFTAHDFANLSNDGNVATQTENTLNHYGFVEGYGKTWKQESSGHGLIEAVMAFAGGQGAKGALTALHKGDESDASYRYPDSITGISTYYGAHFVDTTNNSFEDFFGFVKGNDVFAILFVSSHDDVAALAAAQAHSQYDVAPSSTIPRSQWPENAAKASPVLLAGLAIAGTAVLVVVGLAVFLAVRRRSPAMAGAYAMAGIPVDAVQMSPDGYYWWDGQAWREASKEAPPKAQRSSDGAYWWDGRMWRPAAATPPAS